MSFDETEGRCRLSLHRPSGALVVEDLDQRILNQAILSLDVFGVERGAFGLLNDRVIRLLEDDPVSGGLRLGERVQFLIRLLDLRMSFGRGLARLMVMRRVGRSRISRCRRSHPRRRANQRRPEALSGVISCAMSNVSMPATHPSTLVRV